MGIYKEVDVDELSVDGDTQPLGTSLQIAERDIIGHHLWRHGELGVFLLTKAVWQQTVD